MRAMSMVFMLTSIPPLLSCSDLINTSASICEPKCGVGLQCREGICQPLLCSEMVTCPSELLCYEGRCVSTCDDQAPCLNGNCVEGLCEGEMECQNGDIKSCETECGEGVERCVDYAWTTCSSGLPAPTDVCEDGLDNDCDEQVDEGCPDCENGAMRPCDNECGVGDQSCAEGTWSACSVLPPDGSGLCPCMEGSFERCESSCGEGQRICAEGSFGACLYEGVMCECAPGAMESCETMCGAGQRSCEGGVWSICQGPQPQMEICQNLIDEDCDQNIDEGCEDCLAAPLNSNDFFASITESYQSVSLATGGVSAWLAWYSGISPRRAYAQSFQIEDQRIVKGERVTLPINSVNDLVSLGGGGHAHIGIEGQSTIHVTYLGSTGISSSVNFTPGGTVWESEILGEPLSQIVIYRSDDLYLSKLERSAPEMSSPPLRLSTKVDHLGHDSVWGGDRVAVVYQDNTGDFPEGRVLSMVQASADGRTVLNEAPILEPSTQERIFTSGPPTVTFKSNQYMITYTHRVDGRSHIYTLVTDLDGQVLVGPHLIARSTEGLFAQGLDLTANDQYLGLVWFESGNSGDFSEIKYMRLDHTGLPSSDVKVIARGNLRMFPQIEWNYLEQVLISWTQTDIEAEFGVSLPTIRLGQYDSDPACQ